MDDKKNVNRPGTKTFYLLFCYLFMEKIKYLFIDNHKTQNDMKNGKRQHKKIANKNMRSHWKH